MDGVRDVEASVQWYAKVLGLKEIYRWDPVPVMIGAGDTKLALFPAAEDAEPPTSSRPGTPLRWRLVAWRTTDRGFQRAQDHLSACGVPFDGPIDHEKAKSIYFSDLDGHPLEITHYLDQYPTNTARSRKGDKR